MSIEKTLDKKWIKQRVGECCSAILTELERQSIFAKNSELLKFAGRECESRFKLSSDESYPMNLVVGEMEFSSWSAKSCYCLDITSDENGYLKLSSPEVKFVFCDFVFKDIQTDFSIFQKIEIVVYEIYNTYGELPENSKKLPEVAHSYVEDKQKFTFTHDCNGGNIAYIEYCCYKDGCSINDTWEWINPAYSNQRTAKERERYSVEAANIYERQYEQALASNPYQHQAYDISLIISNIYIRMYGNVSDEPALVEAYRREYNAAQYSRHEYLYKIKALEKMRSVKYKYPEVDYPNFHEITSEIKSLEPLAIEEGWRYHLR